MIHINCQFQGKRYYLNTFTGWLISKKIKEQNIHWDLANKKAKKLFHIVQNPFLTKKWEQDIFKPVKISKSVQRYAEFLIWLNKYFHMGLFLAKYLRLNIFENAQIAAKVFCKCHPRDQKILCLPRSIFIATTSKNFKKNGAMFIGIFLPSKHMHAWIIEDEQNPCRFDTIWTNFTPMVMMI